MLLSTQFELEKVCVWKKANIYIAYMHTYLPIYLPIYLWKEFYLDFNCRLTF